MKTTKTTKSRHIEAMANIIFDTLIGTYDLYTFKAIFNMLTAKYIVSTHANVFISFFKAMNESKERTSCREKRGKQNALIEEILIIISFPEGTWREPREI